MAFKLSIEQGNGRGQAFDFDAEQITIGRTDENDVVLYEQGVSRQHARISKDGGKYYVEDLESANGTLLNGAKVQREILKEGDTVGIGAVVFRFGAAGKATTAKATPAKGTPPVQKSEGSTRIVSIAKDDLGTVVRAPVLPTGPKAPAPSAGEAPLAGPIFNPRLVIAGIAAALIFAIGWAALKGDGRKAGPKKQNCPDVIVLDGIRGDIFGTVADSECRMGKELKFGFKAQPRTRYYLEFSSFFTEMHEVQILLNDRVIGDTTLASTRRSTHQEIRIDDSFVKPDANYITFRPAKTSEWGIERLELISIPLDQASAEKGALAFQLATLLYQQKNVASANLYNAFLQSREAWRFMEGLPDPKPPNYAVVKDLLKTVGNELDRLCNDELFAAKKEANYGHWEQSNNHYKFINAAFPGDEHPCRDQAQRQSSMAGK